MPLGNILQPRFGTPSNSDLLSLGEVIMDPYGEPVTSFGDAEHKHLDVARCSSIQ